jgi:hypothetical protein
MPAWVDRTGWFVILWIGGVLAMAIFAVAFRAIMHAAGLTT